MLSWPFFRFGIIDKSVRAGILCPRGNFVAESFRYVQSGDPLDDMEHQFYPFNSRDKSFSVALTSDRIIIAFIIIIITVN